MSSKRISDKYCPVCNLYPASNMSSSSFHLSDTVLSVWINHEMTTFFTFQMFSNMHSKINLNHWIDFGIVLYLICHLNKLINVLSSIYDWRECYFTNNNNSRSIRELSEPVESKLSQQHWWLALQALSLTQHVLFYRASSWWWLILARAFCSHFQAMIIL